MNLRPKRLIPLVIVAFALAAPAIANAAPPANDAFASAVTIDPTTLPFAASVPIDEATMESEPGGCYGIQKSVWYRITPSSSGRLQANVDPSLLNRVLYVYRRSRFRAACYATRTPTDGIRWILGSERLGDGTEA